LAELCTESGAGRYNLAFQERQTCFHDDETVGTARRGLSWKRRNHDKNIQAEVAKTSAHHVAGYSAREARRIMRRKEGQERDGLPLRERWHIECDDCHNPILRGDCGTLGTNAITSTSPIWGAGGVEPSWPAAWSVPTTFTYFEPIGSLDGGRDDQGIPGLSQMSFLLFLGRWQTSSVHPNLTDQRKSSIRRIPPFIRLRGESEHAGYVRHTLDQRQPDHVLF